MLPDLSDPKKALITIRWAHDQIRGHVHRSPTVECRALSAMAGVRLLLKCENLQRGGAFKVRGALAKAVSLPAEARDRGLVTYSSGNHAQGVALAARALRTHAVVVMPEDAAAPKVAATRGYGAEVLFAGRTNEDRRAVAERVEAERGLCMVPPFDDPYVICGQGTLAVELLEEWPDASAIYVPIGGGGLISGVALAVKALGFGTAVIGVEPKGAAKAAASVAAGERVRLPATDTVADGLRALAVGERNWEVIRKFVDEVITVEEDEILGAVRTLIERAKLVAEPSGATALAGALRHAGSFRGPVGVVVSGGNIAPEALIRAMGGREPAGAVLAAAGAPVPAP